MPILKVIYHQDEAMVQRTGARKYQDDLALDDVISYCMVPSKTPTCVIGGFGVNLNQAAYEMKRLSEAYGKFRGLRLRHMILSFSKQEIERFRSHVYDSLSRIAYYAASYYGGQYQIIYSLHEDSANLHIHFVMNVVSFLTGKKYSGTKEDYYRFQDYLGSFLWEYYRLQLITVSDHE